MFSKKLNKVLLNFIIYSFLNSCANIAPPTGGKKDEKVPVVKNQYPNDKTTNYKNGKFEIVFNEKIQINEQLISLIPNHLNTRITSKINKNKLTISIKDSLRANTTYKLNLDDAVGDLTENNKIKNLSMTFSTGNTIDSLSIKGKITYLNTNNIVNNARIHVYESDSLNKFVTKNIVTSTKSKENGDYELVNLKKGKYSIISFLDKNNNNIPDLDEIIGFKNQYVELTKNVEKLDFKISNQKNNTFKVVNVFTNENKSEVTFNKGYKNILVKGDVYYQLLEGEKKLLIYERIAKSDSTEITIEAEDSLQNKLSKTVKVLFKSKKGYIDTKTIIYPQSAYFFSNVEKLKIQFSKPIKNKETVEIYIKENNKDSLLLKSNEVKWNNENDKIFIDRNLASLDSIKIILKTNKTFTVSNDTLKGKTVFYKIAKEEQIGNISGIVNYNFTNGYIQLVDNNYNLVLSQKLDKQYTFNGIKPGKYFVRVINDKNNNGFWDASDINKNELAEEMYYYTEEINLKENWEVKDINIQCE